MKKIVLVGAGGHCISVMDAIIRSKEYEIVAITDLQTELGKKVGHMRVSHTDSELEDIKNSGVEYAFITVGGIGDTSVRRKIYSKLKSLGYKIPIIADPSAVISEYSNIGEGVFIGKNTVINAYAQIGCMAILNTASVIEHECQIGEFVSIAPGATLSGNVCVENDTHVGTNATIIENCKIGSRSMIGAGSVVVGNIDSNKKAYGNPCREVGLW